MNAAGSEHLNGKSVFVTGATGFIGKRLVPALLDSGAKVTALLRSRHGARALEAMGVHVVTGALADRGALETALRGQDVLFHLAYDMRAPAADNLEAFDALKQAAEAASVGRIIHISSIVVYDGWPQDDLTEDSLLSRTGGTPYSRAKMAMEQALIQGNCPVAILQPTLVYGPGSMLWTDRLADWMAAGSVVLPEPEGQCNAVFVDDLVQAMLRAAVLQGLGQERFIISGTPFSWSDLLTGYAGIIGKGTVRHAPLADLAARLPQQEQGETPTHRRWPPGSAPPRGAGLAGNGSRHWCKWSNDDCRSRMRFTRIATCSICSRPPVSAGSTMRGPDWDMRRNMTLRPGWPPPATICVQGTESSLFVISYHMLSGIKTFDPYRH